MRIALEILLNFGLMAAVCIISGYLIKWDKTNKKFAFMQGVLFGMIAVLGMFQPLVLSTGLIFDGRSIILSLCGLFFGPIAAVTASVFAMAYRIYQGGAGTTMGILVILGSSAIGSLFYRYRSQKKREVTLGMLSIMGLDVHVFMILCIFTLPETAVLLTFKTMALIIITIYPILTVGLGLILKKINKQYLRLIESEERFRKIFEMAPMGISLAGTKNCQYLQVNQHFADIVGRSAEELRYLKWSEITHPEDLQGNRGMLEAYLKDEIESLDFDKRYIRPDGEVVWANLKLVDFGQENCQLAFIEDITEKKRYLDELASSELTFRTLFENSADAIFIIDEDKISDCNQASIDFFEVTDKSELIGRSPYGDGSYFQPDGQKADLKGREWVEECLTEGKAKFEWWHKRHDGVEVPVEIMLSKIILKGRVVVHALCRDITERKELENHLQHMSYRDQLTGVYNRRFFEEELLRLDVPRNLPFTVVMADVNGLKLINDSFGHGAGDELLIKAAKMIQAGCRSEDVVSRIGGDEFAIMLPKTTEETAAEIIKGIENLMVQEDVHHMEISIAFGRETKHGGEDIHQVLKNAEDQMYKMKLFKSQGIRLKGVHAITQTFFEKSPREEQHARSVSALTEKMGLALGLEEVEVKALSTIGLLHDIGKIAETEYLVGAQSLELSESKANMNRHPEIGYRILSSANEFADLAEAVLSHHENWDGSGYPRGLAGEEIPFYGRILSIADTFEHLKMSKVYTQGFNSKEALAEIEKGSGNKFDPSLVVIFKKMLNEGLSHEDPAGK